MPGPRPVPPKRHTDYLWSVVQTEGTQAFDATCPQLCLIDGSGGRKQGLCHTQRSPSLYSCPAPQTPGFPLRRYKVFPGEGPSRKMNCWSHTAEFQSRSVLTHTLSIWLSNRVCGKMNNELQLADLKRDPLEIHLLVQDFLHNHFLPMLVIPVW